jgi:hypothetical protein
MGATVAVGAMLALGPAASAYADDPAPPPPGDAVPGAPGVPGAPPGPPGDGPLWTGSCGETCYDDGDVYIIPIL